jgi:hypothetical protein
MQADLEDLIGKEVVVDTDGAMIYIGTLLQVGRETLMFGEVDVHDMRDSLTTTTREVYIMKCRKHGYQANRDGARVPLVKVASVSLLCDIKVF